MQSSIVSACSSIDWQVFATLTFKNPVLSQTAQSCLVFAWLRNCCKVGHVHFKRSIWVLRGEFGEATARFHYHVLLARLVPKPGGVVSNAMCVELKHDWEHYRFNKGAFAGKMGDIARVWPYASTLNGVGYVLKGLERYAFQNEAQIYELTKFGFADRVTISSAFASYIAKIKVKTCPETIQTVKVSETASQVRAYDACKRESHLVDKAECDWLCLPVYPVGGTSC